MPSNPKNYEDLFDHLIAFHEKHLPEDDQEFYDFMCLLNRVVLGRYFQVSRQQKQPIADDYIKSSAES